jgi:hypothetical protein
MTTALPTTKTQSPPRTRRKGHAQHTSSLFLSISSPKGPALSTQPNTRVTTTLQMTSGQKPDDQAKLGASNNRAAARPLDQG